MREVLKEKAEDRGSRLRGLFSCVSETGWRRLTEVAAVLAEQEREEGLFGCSLFNPDRKDDGDWRVEEGLASVVEKGKRRLTNHGRGEEVGSHVMMV